MRHPANSAHTYGRFCSALSNSGTTAPSVPTLSEWKRAVKSVHDKVEVVCTKCAHVATPKVNNFVKNRQIACLCNGQAKSSSPLYKEQLCNQLRAAGLECLTPLANAHTRTRLVVRCTTCKVEAETCISNLKRCFTIWCSCKSTFPFATTLGLAKVVEAVERSRFEWTSQPTELEWISEHMSSNSRLELKCTTCNQVVRPSILAFMHGCRVGCGCTNRTEDAAVNYVRTIIETVSGNRDLEVSTQIRNPNLRGVGGKPLSIDAAVSKDNQLLLYIEIDGGHHFFDDVYGFQDCRTNDGGGQAGIHDLRKEKFAMEHSIPMMRICVQTIRENRDNWTGWAQACILKAVDRKLPAGIYRWSLYDSYNRSPFYMPMRVDEPLLLDTLSPQPIEAPVPFEWPW